jgi:hypothetical protein
MSPVGLILVVLLVLILLGGIGGPYIGAPWSTGYGGGYWGVGGVGLVLVIIIILILMGRF